MRRPVSLFLILAALGVPICGQELRLQDPGEPAVGTPVGTMAHLPIDPAQRRAVGEAIRARDYRRAETILLGEIDKNPRSTPLLKALGSVFFLDGKYLDTVTALKKAEAIEPLDNQSRFTLALAYIILNHRDWARPELAKLEKSDAANPLYPYWLGRLDYDAMQFTAAVERFQHTLRLDSNFMKAYDNLGLCYEALGKYDEAIETYKEAIRLSRAKLTCSPWPPLNLATLLVKIGRLDEAETYLKESLGCDPRFPKAHYQMGLMLEKQRKDEEALQELKEAAANDPGYAEPHYVMGKIYRRGGDPQKANAEWATFQKLKKEKSEERPL
ncbi:MAG TPA: tetratricopeptide repeat protein [Terriglobia bacterium]|nr:tetratricopeptide repeat protein [Terriglobia bacterium]